MIKTLPLFLILSSFAVAQTSPSESLTSPEIHRDRRVTFRIRAPKASEVTIFGDWMPIGSQEKLTKDKQGVWSITLGPLAAGSAIYNFYVDGLAIADPINPRIKLRAKTSASIVDVPGDGTELWQHTDVPHGLVAINWDKSKVIHGETRAIWVYTPPGYAQNTSARFPVLYLLHGSNDTAAGWTSVGHANFILDNLIAQKRAVPMIIVMPWGHAVPFGAPREVQSTNTAVFEQYLLEDVIPTIEERYRIAPGRENRAIVGLSMGGGQTLHIGLGHVDLFSAVGAFSSVIPSDFETQFHSLLEDAQGTNAKLKLFWIGCGKQDNLIRPAQKLSDLLDSHKIRHTFRVTDGRHNYTLWRQYLGEIAPLLFR